MVRRFERGSLSFPTTAEIAAGSIDVPVERKRRVRSWFFRGSRVSSIIWLGQWSNLLCRNLNL